MLKELLEQHKAIRYGDFTLTSGKKSHYYVNIKEAASDPEVLGAIARNMARIILDAGVDRIAGMELGAVPIAAACALETGIPFLMVRKGERGHGARKLVEGGYEPGMKVIIVEDVATTGGSVVRTAEILRSEGMKVEYVVVVVDREEGGAGALEAANLKLTALITASQLGR